ncbi:MAG: DHHW family protein [Anaerovoracaceae bacterium]
MNKMKQIITLGVFLAIIFGFALGHIFLADKELSKTERRQLAEFPEFSSESLLDSEYSNEVETYLLDQFPMREKFRTIKSNLKFNVFMQKDNNKIYLVDDGVYKWEDKLDEKQIMYFAKKINEVCNTYFKDNNIFYTVVPDKNYFVAEKNGYPAFDYDKMMTLVNDNVKKAKYIDIFDSLKIDDYYRTDAHWKQESLEGVVSTIGKAMGISDRLSKWDSYYQTTLSPFYGVYSGQSAVDVKPDTITYLENDVTKNGVVTGAEFNGEVPVYTLEEFKSMDSYGIFLKGAQAVLEVKNPKAKTDKELIIFRDSFGSSISPLLLSAYSKVTLVDLRYIATNFVGEFVDISDQDVLFLYSTSLINSGLLLK